MSTALKWIGRVAVAFVLLAVVTAGAVYALSERLLNRTYDVSAAAIPIPTDSAAIAEGKRLAVVRGCYNGCHGEAAKGGVFFDDPMLGTITAPDLTRAVHDLSDTELERVIRHGVLPDDRSVTAMPSASFYHLTDADLGKIIAFLRSLPRSDGATRDVKLGPLGRILFVKGDFEPAALAIDHDAARLDPGDGSDPAALGRYVAMTVCTECHGSDLSGGYEAPNLAIVASYTPEEFETLMRTGEPRDGRDLNLMDDVARVRFSHLSNTEIAALHTYLSQRLGEEQTTSAADD